VPQYFATSRFLGNPAPKAISSLNQPILDMKGGSAYLGTEGPPAAFSSLSTFIQLCHAGTSNAYKVAAPMSIVNVPATMAVLVVWHPYDNNQVTDAILYMSPRQVTSWAFYCFSQLKVRDFNRGPVVDEREAEPAGAKYIAVIANDTFYSYPTIRSCTFKVPTNFGTFQPLTE
jgi:hypothetical protein